MKSYVAPCHFGKALAMTFVQSVLVRTNLIAWETGKKVHSSLVLNAAELHRSSPVLCKMCLGEISKIKT